MLYEAKQNQEANIMEVRKSLCADTAMLIGQTNFHILSFRRAKIMPELNYSYRQLSIDQGDQPKLLFGCNLPKQIKDISETNKVEFAISKKSFTPSSSISIPPHKSPKNKIQPLFCTGTGEHQEEDLGTCRVSRSHTIKITENSRADGTNPTTRITTKNQSRNVSTLWHTGKNNSRIY